MKKKGRTLFGSLVLALLVALPAAAGEPPSAECEDQNAQPSQGYITGPMNIVERFRQPVANGCVYTADISGTLRPIGEAGLEPRVDPNIFMNAMVTCPGGASARLTANIMQSGPLTLGELEDALEQRGTVVTDQPRKQCVYRPEFQFVKGRLRGVDVTVSCPTPARKPGGGRK